MSSDRKSANLTTDRLSQAALNTEMYPNNINCLRIDTFSIYASIAYWQRQLSQKILPARTSTLVLVTYSSFSSIYTTTSCVIIFWQSSLLASITIGRQQPWWQCRGTWSRPAALNNWLSTDVVNYSHLRVVSMILSTDAINYSHLRVVATIFKDIIVTTNIIVYEHYCYCCMFLLVKILCMDTNITA